MQVVAASAGHCVWYGECPQGTTKLNCYYNGPAKQLDAGAAQILIELCPMLDIDHRKYCYFYNCYYCLCNSCKYMTGVDLLTI